MKHLYKIGLFSLLVLTTLLSCEEEVEDLVLTQPDPQFDLNSGTITSVVLNPSYPENPSISLSWEDELSESGTYSVVMATDASFTNPISLGSSSGDSYALDAATLNGLLLDAGAMPYQPITIFVRVSNGSQTTSVVQYEVTPYVEDAQQITQPTDGSSFVLNGDAENAMAVTLNWSDFETAGTGVLVNYFVETALAGTDFADFVSSGPYENTLSLAWTNAQLNNLALSLGIEEEGSGQLDIRIRSTIDNNTGILERTSNPITIGVTTFSTALRNLFLVGSATAPGWDNNNNNPALIRDPNDKNAYSYTAFFRGGGDNAFKMLEQTGQWQPQWGVQDGMFTSSETLGFDPGVMSFAEDGYYTINVNTKEQTYTATPYDASAMPTYGSIGIIGDSTPNGWDGDTDLTNSDFDPHIWTIKGITLNDGFFKFRADDDWANNWGSTTSLSGFANLGSPDNMPIKAGTYDIWFNDLTGGYILVPQE
ncbi:MAG: SusE domain-containing protein [Leeuwenhoekiella sp.]